MRYTRRRFLAATALGVPGLAGCAGQEGTPTPSPTDDGQLTATPSPSGTSTSTEETGRPTATEQPSTATATETGAAEPTRTEGETPTGTGTDSPAETDSDTPTATATPPEGQTVVVGPDGTPRFDPETFTISAGATVRWEWEDDGHNVRPSTTPEDSAWSGTPGGDGTTYDEGYAYEYTFDVPGEYEYYCAPHRSLGMTGSFTVD